MEKESQEDDQMMMVVPELWALSELTTPVPISMAYFDASTLQWEMCPQMFFQNWIDVLPADTGVDLAGVVAFLWSLRKCIFDGWHTLEKGSDLDGWGA
eukprot:14526818-Ditylum_brightwellii.AAC.1